MRRSLHIGIFIGTLLGMSACAAPGPHDGTVAGPYGSVEVGRER